MSKKDITSREIIAEVRKLAEEQPEYIYKSQGGFCFYHANDDHDACIFGQAFARLGIEIPSTSEGNSIYSVMDKLGIPYAEHWHKDWMMEVQKLQDTGSSWSLAVRRADRSFKPRDPADS